MIYIDKFKEYLKVLKKCSNYTIINYEHDILELEDFLKKKKKSLLDINYDLVKEYMIYLYDKKLTRSSISRKLSSLRGFYNYLREENILDCNYFNDLSNPKKEKSLPKYLKDDDLEKIFLVPNKKTILGQRNSLIVELLYATGIRVSELVNIKLNDINKYDHSIKILGKGSKERMVYFGSYCEDAINLYLNDGRKRQDKYNSNYLLLNKNGYNITDRQIRNILNDIILKASIDIHVSPHMLRHTFATDMLKNGADLVSVKELLGHESLDTTSIYTHVTNEQIRNVYNMAHPRAKE